MLFRSEGYLRDVDDGHARWLREVHVDCYTRSDSKSASVHGNVDDGPARGSVNQLYLSNTRSCTGSNYGGRKHEEQTRRTFGDIQ